MISPFAGRSTVGTAPSGVRSDNADTVRCNTGRALRGDDDGSRVDDVGRVDLTGEG